MKVLFILGTRPDAIKFAPVIKEFQRNPDKFESKVCVTAQHRQMLDQVLNFFGIIPDDDRDLMKPNQTLFEITGNILKGLEKVLDNVNPDIIFVQGDTTTAFVGALAGFYKKIKIAHIEAGLRSGDRYSPFPEEMNRVLIGHLSNYHFAPTEKAKENLFNEGIRENVYLVGNTGIDALFMGLNIIKQQGEKKYVRYFDFIDFRKKIVLVTAHRRENFGKPLKNVCYALKKISNIFHDVEIIYPVHFNPNIRNSVNKILSGIKNIHLIEPLDYPHFLWIMQKSYLILTDSGGIQEEAPTLGIPLLVMRNVTERNESVLAGTAKIVKTNTDNIISEVSKLLTNDFERSKMSCPVNLYGNGHAAQHIFRIIEGCA